MYPSDFDIFEKIVGSSENNVVSEFIVGIKNIIKKIKENEMIFRELKCGIDKRYYITDKYHNLLGFDQSHFFTEINKVLLDPYLLDPDSRNIITNAIRSYQDNKSKENSIKQYVIIKKILREYGVLRWNIEEIEQGYKKVRGFPLKKNIIYLSDAIKQHGDINIEIIAFINGYFKSCSNYFILAYLKGKKKTGVNVTDDYLIRHTYYIAEDFKKFFKYNGTYQDYQPFKVSRRYLSLSLLTKDTETTIKILPLVTSDVSKTNQITKRLLIIAELFDELTLSQLDTDKIYENLQVHINNLKELVYSDIILSDKLKNDIIDVLNSITSVNYLMSYDQLPTFSYDSLSQNIIILQDIVNSYSSKYLFENGLFPIPHKYEPSNQSKENNYLLRL